MFSRGSPLLGCNLPGVEYISHFSFCNFFLMELLCRFFTWGHSPSSLRLTQGTNIFFFFSLGSFLGGEISLEKFQRGYPLLVRIFPRYQHISHPLLGTPWFLFEWTWFAEFPLGIAPFQSVAYLGSQAFSLFFLGRCGMNFIGGVSSPRFLVFKGFPPSRPQLTCRPTHFLSFSWDPMNVSAEIRGADFSWAR